MTNLIKETCGHPALLAYNVGNEFPPDNKVFDDVKKTISIIRNKCPSALVTYSTEDDPNRWSIGEANKNKEVKESPLLKALGNVPGSSKSATGIDFLLLNEYRNDANGEVKGPYPQMFAQIKTLAEAYRVPVVIGETGEYDNQHFNSNWYNDEWQYILHHAKKNHVLGSLYFSYNDEPIKKGGNQRYMGIVTAAWPQNVDMNTFFDPEDKVKDQSYTGIDKFTADGQNISYPGSKVGVGRFDMFTDTRRCNYLTGQELSPTTGPCAN